jgi:hypothetical protein
MVSEMAAGVADTVMPAANRANGADSGAGDPIYIYAVMPNVDLVGLPRSGVDPLRAVETLPVGNVLAVISKVRHAIFNDDAVEAGLRDMAWIEARVVAHQQVMDALVQTGLAVIPMRFCTIYRSVAAVTDSIIRSEAALGAELARLQGKQEWGIKQIVDLPALQRAINQGHPALGGTVDPDIERLRRQIAGMSPGAAFLLQKKLLSLVAERAQNIAFALGDECHTRMAARAVDAVTSALPQDRPEVCLNAAYLVERAAFDPFHAELERLAEAYSPVGVRYELSGPWPAHHFLKLNLDASEAAG